MSGAAVSSGEQREQRGEAAGAARCVETASRLTMWQGSGHQSVRKVCHMVTKHPPERSTTSSTFLMCSISEASALEGVEALHLRVEAIPVSKMSNKQDVRQTRAKARARSEEDGISVQAH